MNNKTKNFTSTMRQYDGSVELFVVQSNGKSFFMWSIKILSCDFVVGTKLKTKQMLLLCKIKCELSEINHRKYFLAVN